MDTIGLDHEMMVIMEKSAEEYAYKKIVAHFSVRIQSAERSAAFRKWMQNGLYTEAKENAMARVIEDVNAGAFEPGRVLSRCTS